MKGYNVGIFVKQNEYGCLKMFNGKINLKFLIQK